jgi:hypothetical protein
LLNTWRTGLPEVIQFFGIEPNSPGADHNNVIIPAGADAWLMASRRPQPAWHGQDSPRGNAPSHTQHFSQILAACVAT